MHMAASGYVEFDPASESYTLSDEAAMVFADEQSPAFLAGGFEVLTSLFHDIDKVQRRIPHGHRARLARARPRALRRHRALLPPRLQREPRARAGSRRSTGSRRSSSAGAQVADVGCGHGASTIMMAKAYPKSTFVGLRLPRRRRSRRPASRPPRPGSRTASASRSRRREGLPGQGLRPGRVLRLPARHGRPGGRGGGTSARRWRRTGPG